MTNEEKAALEWLENGLKCWNPATKAKGATLKAMLARPTLPEEPDPDALRAMRDASRDFNAYEFPGTYAHCAYRALYAHLTKPKTKTVWRVEGTWSSGDSAGPADFHNIQQATDAARCWHKEGCHSMSITQVEVPT